MIMIIIIIIIFCTPQLTDLNKTGQNQSNKTGDVALVNRKNC